eukprot:3757427-Alexandrium_andersonii.AAC.1
MGDLGGGGSGPGVLAVGAQRQNQFQSQGQNPVVPPTRARVAWADVDEDDGMPDPWAEAIQRKQR